MRQPAGWLLAIPDAISQLEQLDRPLLTRRDIERLFGVGKVRAAALMKTFGAELVGNQRDGGITAYLSNGGTLEHAQQIAGHASPKTTKLYDRTADRQGGILMRYVYPCAITPDEGGGFVVSFLDVPGANTTRSSTAPYAPKRG